ncbi:glyoxalase-like domain-containing protein [Xylariales sp. AK1849]|nr:glyoxalase-like domain-containing protein [Xylariales sp. AK1849]
MASSVTTPRLDHLVVLVPHSCLTSPPKWFAELFTLYPGGKHADGATENTLVLLPDGSYIEFIAFVPGIDPAKREEHKWGKKKEGTVIDWAFTLPGSTGEGLGEQEAAFKEIQERVRGTNTGISYGNLVSGGRHRPDGELLKWAVAAAYHTEEDPPKALEPGQLPFWCLDDTPRNLRVPYTQPGVTNHATGAVGVALVSVTPNDEEEVANLDKVYDALLGEEGADADSLWDFKTLTGDELHAGGQIRLEAVGDAPSVSFSLFTDSELFAGQKVGGKLDDSTALEFELVAAR